MAGWYDDDDDVELSEEGQRLVEQGWSVYEEEVWDTVWDRWEVRRIAVKPPGKDVTEHFLRCVAEGWLTVEEETTFDEYTGRWTTSGGASRPRDSGQPDERQVQFSAWTSGRPPGKGVCGDGDGESVSPLPHTGAGANTPPPALAMLLDDDGCSPQSKNCREGS